MRFYLLAVTAGAAVVLPLSASPAAAAALPKPHEIVIEAGAHDRRDVVVSFAIPEGEVGPFRLREGKKDVPLQIAGGRGFFVVDAVKSGATKSYTLETVKAGKVEPGVEARTEGDEVHFSWSGRKILEYRGGKGTLPEDVKEEYRRAGYFHPIYTPDGRAITDNMPKDHRHHHGIWLAWTKTEIDGHEVDFWNMGQKLGGVQFESLDEVWSGPAFAGLHAKNKYLDLTGPSPVTALMEKLDLRVYGVGNGAAGVTGAAGSAAAGAASGAGSSSSSSSYALFDLDVTHDRVGTTPIKLPTYHYGGLGFRGSAEWKATPSLVTVLTSEGKDRKDANESRGRWYRISGLVEGKPAAFVSFSHPGNFRFPQPMRVNPDDPFICWAPSQLGEWEIKPGEPYVSRYRFAVFASVPEVPEIERLWNDYAEPAKVTVK
jgi:hypothetical protein